MLTLSGITKAYGGRTLFSDVTLQLNREDRIGLVGPNGAGKSTLFGIILGGAHKPMIWGSLIVGLSIALLMPTNLLLGQYRVLAIVDYTLFGLGLAFYATPSTDAALSNLPDDQAGSGSGLYKMASSLGASFGVAISAAIFTALSADSESTHWLEGVIAFAGRQDNLAVRQAAADPSGQTGDDQDNAEKEHGQHQPSPPSLMGARTLPRRALNRSPTFLRVFR